MKGFSFLEYYIDSCYPFYSLSFKKVSDLFLISAAVRVGMVDEEVVINPTRKQLQNSTLNIIVTGTKDRKVGKDSISL